MSNLFYNVGEIFYYLWLGIKFVGFIVLVYLLSWVVPVALLVGGILLCVFGQWLWGVVLFVLLVLYVASWIGYILRQIS